WRSRRRRQPGRRGGSSRSGRPGCTSNSGLRDRSARRTPPATFVDVPKLDRMSLRTTPLWVRTSGPFEPSPGNGPAVSSGITAQSAAAAVDAPLAEPDDALELADAELPADPLLDPAGPQAARVKSPALTPLKPIAFSTLR